MIKFFLRLFPRKWLIIFSYWLKPFINFWYKGNRFKDPINGKSYRKFLDYGYKNVRKQVLSPGTLSLERHRLLWIYLQRETDFFNNKNLKVLHIAPEQCFLKRFKSLSFKMYITADLYSPIVDVKTDIRNLSFENESFDWVICNHVLEHIDNDKKALSEIFRVLKPKGKTVLQTPIDSQLPKTIEDPTITDPKEREEKFGQYDHVRLYGLDLKERIAKAGFESDLVFYANTLTEKEREQYRIPKTEIIPIGIKL